MSCSLSKIVYFYVFAATQVQFQRYWWVALLLPFTVTAFLLLQHFDLLEKLSSCCLCISSVYIYTLMVAKIRMNRICQMHIECAHSQHRELPESISSYKLIHVCIFQIYAFMHLCERERERRMRVKTIHDSPIDSMAVRPGVMLFC